MIKKKKAVKPAKKKKKTAPGYKNKPTLVAFLLDRSSSMGVCKAETIGGFNGYVDQLKDESMRMTLTQFDSQSIDILHDAEPISRINKLTSSTYQTRGATPLFDAIGKTIAATEKQAGTKYKVLFVTLTDGEENSSHEFNQEKIRELIKKMEDKHAWTFAHIGVGINGWNAARAYSIGTQSASNVLMSSHEDTKAMYQGLGAMTCNYATSTANVGRSATDIWDKQGVTMTISGSGFGSAKPKNGKASKKS